MQDFYDWQALEVKGTRVKRGLLTDGMTQEINARLIASVNDNMFMVDVPEKKIRLKFRLQDVVAVATMANRAYKRQAKEDA